MEDKSFLQRTAMHLTRGCLVVPIQGELYDDLLLQIQMDILEKIKETGAKGVILDVSGVDIIDSFYSQTISDTAQMVSLLGATTVLTGIKPGVVSSLVDLDFEFQNLQTVINLEEAFRRLEPVVWSQKREESSEESIEDESDERSARDGLEEDT